MILKTKCIQCGVEIEFKEKEIIRMTNKELKDYNQMNESWLSMLKETKTEGILRRRTILKYSGRMSRELIKSQITIPYGHIICPVCKKDQLLIKEII